MYLVGFSENDPNFSSIWLISDNENGTWTRVGPSGPATSLRGNMCWVRDRVVGGEGREEGESGRWGSRAEGESGEVSGPVGELGEGEGEGRRGSG